MDVKRPFRICGACGHAWETLEDFLEDPETQLLGLQATVDLPVANLLVFQHEQCGSTVSLLASRLRHLLDPIQPEWQTLLTAGQRCKEECVKDPMATSCHEACVNAPDRRILRLIRERKPGRA